MFLSLSDSGSEGVLLLLLAGLGWLVQGLGGGGIFFHFPCLGEHVHHVIDVGGDALETLVLPELGGAGFID